MRHSEKTGWPELWGWGPTHVVIARETSKSGRWLCAGWRTLAAALLWNLRNWRRRVCRRRNPGIATRNRDGGCAAGLGCAVRDSRRLVEAELRNCLVPTDRSAIRDVARRRVGADGNRALPSVLTRPAVHD